MLGEGADVGILERRGTGSPVSKLAEQCENGGRIAVGTLSRDCGEDFANGPQLVRFVKNDKITLITQLFDVLPEDANTKRMKRAQGGALGRAGFLVGIFWAGFRFGHEFPNPRLHLPGRLVGESDREDLARG